MTSSNNFQWRRDQDGLGVWEHRGKVAIVGYGHSPVDRRWDETKLEESLGAYTIMACEKAMEQAGVHHRPGGRHRLLRQPHRRRQRGKPPRSGRPDPTSTRPTTPSTA